MSPAALQSQASSPPAWVAAGHPHGPSELTVEGLEMRHGRPSISGPRSLALGELPTDALCLRALRPQPVSTGQP